MREHQQENWEGKLLHRDLQDRGPAVGIWGFAVLDGSQGVVKFQTGRAGFTVFGEDVALAGVGIVHATNWGDDGCRAASAHFLEAFEFVQKHRAAFHLHTHVFGNLNEAFVGDGGQNGFGIRCHIGIVFDHEEIGGATFVNVFFLFRVEVKHGSVTFFMGDVARIQTSGIVTADFDVAGALRCGTVELTHDDHFGWFEAAFEIGADRRNEDDEQVFVGG